ncbi:MAG TPA: hypothetical protein VEU08_12135 [Vicinamibacterales bacterium]|nr:hypothetical protein [Vicinamibacterales bacterium]
MATAAAMAQSAQPPKAPSDQSQKITVTGCLREVTADMTSGTVGTTGTAGTAGSAATATGTTDATTQDQKFVLMNATNGSPTTPATTETESRADRTASAQTYRLIANPSALTPHVGKKLELTGTVDDSPASATTTDAASPFGNAPKLRVESGKIVAASCDQK